MKFIQLTQGKQAIVDDEVFDRLSQFKWRLFICGRAKNEYAVTGSQNNKDGKYFSYLHHAIFGQPINGFCIDHINGNSLDNRLSNLRIVSYRQNNQNRKCHREGQIPGLRLRESGKWQARIWKSSRLVTIGSFKTKEEASKAYEDACFMAQFN